jgi:CubicO group peptidase (beta-lactamase class C family)
MATRRRFRRLPWYLSVAWLFGASALACSDAIDDYVAAEMRQQHIPGLSLALIKSGRVVRAQGYGVASLELNTPAAPGTVYHLASLTKQFTAAAIMLLVQDDKVGLDDPIGRHLESTPPGWRDVTVRQLLLHTSGIKDYLNELHGSTCNGTSPEEIVAYVGGLPLNFAPGSASFYSNTGYLVLGMIVQRASGKSYDEFLEERVFGPLGMKSTRRNDPAAIVPNRAAG